MRFLALAALVCSVRLPGPAAAWGEFRLTIADIFAITGRGIVLTGTVEGGPVRVDDVVCLRSGGDQRREVTIRGIEVYRRTLTTAEPGMSVGLLIADIEQTDVKRGDVLTATCG